MVHHRAFGISGLAGTAASSQFHQSELDRGHCSCKLHHQFLQRLPQHHQWLYTVIE